MKSDSTPGGAASEDGNLVLVVGPSGAGKDSLIDVARTMLEQDPRFVFPTRMITRNADSAGERHVQITEAGFEQMRKSGAFFLSWKAHGHCYALPADIQKHLDQNRVVVANVSRRVIEEAKAKAARVSVVYVTAPKDVIADRLQRRKREDSEQIEARLARYDLAASIPTDSTMIDTADPTEAGLHRAAAKLVRIIGASASPMPAVLQSSGMSPAIHQ
jgi:ribose 1,5-bisphosphokinase